MSSFTMNEPITITEILGRSSQGMTRPFVCRAGFLFPLCYVKGAYAGQRSLCCEWVAGRLAQALLKDDVQLGVPSFAMAEVPRALMAGSARSDIKDLGEGLSFASMRIEEGQELTWSSAQGWPDDTMATLLLLDLWLCNEDRSLSALGGNPNLLVTPVPPLPDWDEEGALWKDKPRREMLWAYDFNLAFDDKFDRQHFMKSHVFAEMLKGWPPGFREKMESRIKDAFERLPDIFSELPDTWLYLQGDDTLAVQLDVERVSSMLSRPFTDPDDFWRTL